MPGSNSRPNVSEGYEVPTELPGSTGSSFFGLATHTLNVRNNNPPDWGMLRRSEGLGAFRFFFKQQQQQFCMTESDTCTIPRESSARFWGCLLRSLTNVSVAGGRSPFNPIVSLSTLVKPSPLLREGVLRVVYPLCSSERLNDLITVSSTWELTPVGTRYS